MIRIKQCLSLKASLNQVRIRQKDLGKRSLEFGKISAHVLGLVA